MPLSDNVNYSSYRTSDRIGDRPAISVSPVTSTARLLTAGIAAQGTDREDHRGSCHSRRDFKRPMQPDKGLDVVAGDLGDLDQVVEWVVDKEARAVVNRLRLFDFDAVFRHASPENFDVIDLQAKM